MNQRLLITPETRVAQLLDAYPQLEQVLIEAAPVFRALKNPVLRRTVAEVATLSKAAGMAGIPARDLVQRLRVAVGQDPDGGDGGGGTIAPKSDEAATRPTWVDETKVQTTIDADELLETGENPLAAVQRDAADLDAGALLCVHSSFRPLPLIELLEGQGYRLHTTQVSPDRFRTFVAARSGGQQRDS